MVITATAFEGFCKRDEVLFLRGGYFSESVEMAHGTVLVASFSDCLFDEDAVRALKAHRSTDHCVITGTDTRH